MAETRKAHERRVRESFFVKYCIGKGIDIGPEDDPITSDADQWTWQNGGDAVHMRGKPDESYWWVYSSHVLEAIDRGKVAIALRNWWRLVIPGGHLIIVVPHRDLYEKKSILPSIWNHGHKTFWLPDRSEPPDTFGLLPMIRSSLKNYDLLRLLVCDEGHTVTDPFIHSDGEYSIELVIRKRQQ